MIIKKEHTEGELISKVYYIPIFEIQDLNSGILALNLSYESILRDKPRTKYISNCLYAKQVIIPYFCIDWFTLSN